MLRALMLLGYPPREALNGLRAAPTLHAPIETSAAQKIADA